jgi:hypothetical protein
MSKETKSTPPAIGQPWQGGIYAGISARRNGPPNSHLVLLDDMPGKSLDWDDAMAWASGLGNGAALPDIYEWALITANLVKPDAGSTGYWSATEISSMAAWLQYWNSLHPGTQYYTVKGSTYCVRAVRRFPVNPIDLSAD